MRVGLRQGAREPRTWGIPVRSAIAAALVMMVSFGVVAAAVVAVRYGQLLADTDALAERRARDVLAGLREDSLAGLDDSLLATDRRIAAVQILDRSGAVVRASPGAPMPLINLGGKDIRVSRQSSPNLGGGYTVLVGASTAVAVAAVRQLALLLAAAMPVVAAGAGAATYVLVRRSLRSVEAIRAEVADISAHDLSGRVPVPAHRDEIAALATTMNDMLARIESGSTAQRRFVGDASHELRSPLTTIISALEIGLVHPEISQEQLTREIVLPEAQRMQTLIDDLLLLARSDERGIALRRDELDLEDLVAEEVTRLNLASPQAVRADLSPARVIGDRQALGRVLRNLVDNAARHADSLVEVTVRVTNGAGCLSVGDDGPGIAQADRERVFERFVRLDADRSRAGGGSGLGLAIVAEIVAAHHGRVTVTDRRGGGTVVTVYLPLDAERSR